MFTSARGVNEDNWSSRWRFADYRLLATARAIRPARFHEEPSPGGGRVLVNVANALPATGPPPGRHAGRGQLFTQSTHGRTTKKNSGSSTPMATLPMYIPFFQSLHLRGNQSSGDATSSPRRLRLLDGVEVHDTSALIPRITWLTGRVPHRRSQIAAARGGRVRIKLDLRRAVIVIICSGTKRTARRSENVHRCAIRDDSTLLRA